jgi:hypothetical protein|tara:strand:- start:250 stop:666 length:417 start_codon:yes stop_codon:yes gene_type:complete
MIKLIIAGGRDFNDYELAEPRILSWCTHMVATSSSDLVILSGCASGADRIGERFADEYDVTVDLYPAKWKDLDVPGAIIKSNRYGEYNAKAGFDRNALMAANATHLIAFWNGTKKNSGTYSMIKLAEEHGLPTVIVKY